MTNPPPKKQKAKVVKAWIYLWPDEKKIQDGHVLFERLPPATIVNLKLRQFKAEIMYWKPRTT